LEWAMTKLNIVTVCCMILGIAGLSSCSDVSDQRLSGQTVSAVADMTDTPLPMETGSPPPPPSGDSTPTADPFRDLNRWLADPGPIPTDSPDEPTDSGPTPYDQWPPTPTP